MADPSMVGIEFPPRRAVVERGKIREFALAIGDDNPLYTDQEAARRAGYPDVITPPTFAQPLDFWNGFDFERVCGDLRLDPLKVLHGEQEYQYLGELYPGDEVVIRTRVAAITEKQGSQGGSMWLLEVEQSMENTQGETVLKARLRIVERK